MKPPASATAAPDVVVCIGALGLGDLLGTTPAVHALRVQSPGAFLAYVAPNAEYCRVLEHNPDLDAVFYRDDLLMHGARLVDAEWCARLPVPDAVNVAYHHFDLAAVHGRGPEAFLEHMSLAFAAHVGARIDSVRPIMRLTDEERALARSLVPGPCVIFGLHSRSPVVGRDGKFQRKEWVLERWLGLARELGASGQVSVVAISGEDDLVLTSRHVCSLHGLPVRIVAALMEQAACVVTIDSGLAHLGHAVDAPMVVLYSHAVPLGWASPSEVRRCRVLTGDLRAIDVATVARAVHGIVASCRPPQIGD